MQQLVLNFHNVQSRVFVLEVNGREFFLNDLTEQIQIEIERDDPVKICIRQQRKSKKPLIYSIAWLFTVLFQGLCNILMVYSEDIWYEKINPYLMEAHLVIHPKDISDVHIYFKDCNKGCWLRTVVECKQSNSILIEHHAYSDAIFSAYIEYVKKVISISSVGIAFFGWVLYSLIAQANASGIRLCVILILLIVVLDIFLVYSQYIQVKKLKKDFCESCV